MQKVTKKEGPKCHGLSKYQKIPKVDKHCKKWPNKDIGGQKESEQKLMRVGKRLKNIPKFARRLPKDYQCWQKMPKVDKRWQKLLRVDKRSQKLSMITRWHGDMMTWWHDDKLTSLQELMITRTHPKLFVQPCPYLNITIAFDLHWVEWSAG